ncbi:transcriptional regulator with XRE-family HTH domain [Streptomyces griseochromogenes]|uniref:Transcriptional regulator n=1 Tax=Streptomyces griseochromogenes TaxID=68214 RepID=A0A1B1B9B8_9ACTN|nr:helix-turn-helix transcriptional regulator [Streptomyces griseochromogenes]ANP55391.1 transcriptional regulator [Streptomyces griseochromogenes]MBP2054374.1 transcriptional regulator with XRE-family HTH domain [Streptomyces griseochromogenes]
MTRWQPLPDALPREARHLVEQLRVLKGRTGLSLAELARRTAYSKSSWQRYLSGARLPPRGAVQVLGRLAGADQARLLVLWELAEQAWPRVGAEPVGPTTAAAEAESEREPGSWPEPGPRAVVHGRWRKAAMAAFAVVLLLAAGLLWALPRARATAQPAARGRAIVRPSARGQEAVPPPAPGP